MCDAQVLKICHKPCYFRFKSKQGFARFVGLFSAQLRFDVGGFQIVPQGLEFLCLSGLRGRDFTGGGGSFGDGCRVLGFRLTEGGLCGFDLCCQFIDALLHVTAAPLPAEPRKQSGGEAEQRSEVKQ